MISMDVVDENAVNIYTTQESPFLGFVDFVYSSDPLLRAGHTYDIRFNADTDNPWIEEVFGEVHPTPV